MLQRKYTQDEQNREKKKQIEEKVKEENEEVKRLEGKIEGNFVGYTYRKCDTPLSFRKQMANRRYTNTVQFVSLTHDMIMLMCIKKIMAQYSLKNHLF